MDIFTLTSIPKEVLQGNVHINLKNYCIDLMFILKYFQRICF